MKIRGRAIRGTARVVIRRMLPAAALLAAGAMLATPAAQAQGSGDGFLFGHPSTTLALRAGYAHANAGSDVFGFVTDQLTLRRSDFSGFSAAGDVGIWLAPRIDLDLGVGYSGSSTPSEFRHFVDQNNAPIQQTTTFQRVPLTASVKLYLAPRGRSIGHFAWIPTRIAPYVGAGGGAMWYRFRQSGDFIDFSTSDVYSDVYNSSGWAPEAHALAGLDVSLTPRLALTGEGRYTWAKAKMSSDFAGFQRIDLSGFGVTAGIAVRF